MLRFLSSIALVLRSLFFLSRHLLFPKKTSAAPLESADLVKVLVDLQRKPMPSVQLGADESLDRQTGTHTHVRNLVDPIEIQELLGFVNSRLQGWSEPIHMPIGSVSVIFFLENRPVAIFGSGLNFFVRGQFPSSRILPAGDQELREFDRIVRIS